MSISETYECLRDIALSDFGDVVVQAELQRLPTGDPRKLRLSLVDGSYADIFLSMTGRYSYHWQRSAPGNGMIFRHDNAPHKAWRDISTFPKHFHDGSEQSVTESYIPDEPEEAIAMFCRFIREQLQHEASKT